VLPLVDEPDVEEVLELPSVRQVQAALKSAGFYQGEVDGKMGPMTKGAIREFQRVNGLEVDGVMGIGTWRLLRKHAPSE
jgi:peptidoglycan hydrolase-like protein with peptidoglycan-binding domain